MSPNYTYALRPHKIDFGVTVNVADLKVDPQAQRTLNERRAQKIADNLVPEAIGEIVVSRRTNGDLFVVDGMHRKRVAELSGITTLNAEVHDGLDVSEEAVLFLLKNRESAKPQPLDEYKVGLTAGLPLFVDTQKVLDRHGLGIGQTSTNSVGAISGTLRVVEQFGAEILDRVFTVAEDAWGRTAESWDGMLIGGLGMFLGRHGDVVDDRELALKLAKSGRAQLWRGAVLTAASKGGLHNSGTGSRVTVAYGLILDAWNKGKTKTRIVI